jgi:hypothetical protein
MYDGYVFFCDNASRQQCLSKKRYSCVGDKAKPEDIREGSVIFLYNTDDNSLLGPFTALTMGAGELDAGAWMEDADEHIPFEDIRVTWEDLHVIQNASEQLAFLKNPKTCRLTTTQTQRSLDLLKKGTLYLYAKEQKES